MARPRDGVSAEAPATGSPSARGAEGREWRLFLLASALLGLGSCVNAAAFNNWLRDTFALDVARRTFLELPREAPGFLVSLTVATLASLGDLRTAALSCLAAGLGMLALGWIPASYGLMLAAVLVLSSGQHVYMAVSNAIGMGFAPRGGEGSVLGRVQAATTIALVTGSVLLLALFGLGWIGYRGAFTAGAACYAAAGLSLFAMRRPPRPAGPPRRFVVRREYGGFYLLSLLFGARKQLFVTFGPWMLVDLFRQGVSTMSFLFLAVSTLGIWVKPLVGRLTDRYGERRVLGAEALATAGICVVYAFAPGLLPPGAALVAVCASYVLDQSSDAVNMTRSVYAKRIVRSPEELSPTLSLGVTIDHVVSMTLPVLGGLAWRSAGSAGYRWVFLGGLAVALLNYLATRLVPPRAATSAAAIRSIVSAER